MSSERIGRYRLLAELARGGMGIVHLGELNGPGGFRKLVVVKELKPELAKDPNHKAMFLDEARLAARLEHRHIVETLEVGCEGDRTFMALEHLSGMTLDDLRKKVAIPRVLALRILADVLSALEYAHSATDDQGKPLGVVHRDVSAKNVFICFDGNVKLLDFGVAKSATARQETRTGMVKGAVPYMSPDHLDRRRIDRRADLFSVGVLMRELVTGKRLWGSLDDLSIIRRLITRDIPALPSEVPADLRPILERSMDPLREHRYFTAREMRQAIEGCIGASDLDLATWLSKNVASERQAHDARLRLARQKRSSPPPLPVPRAPVWLPSTDLEPTRPTLSGVRKRNRGLWLGALVVASLATAGSVLAHVNDRQHEETALRHPRVTTPSALTAVTSIESKSRADAESDPEVSDDVPALPPNPYE